MFSNRAARIGQGFIIWLLFPYLVNGVTLALLQRMWDRPVDFSVLWNREVIGFVLGPILFSAITGTTILWLLPLRRTLWGVLGGILLGGSTVVLWAAIEMKYFGGFEKSIGILWTAALLFLPCCAAGGYAGCLRSKETEPITSQGDAI